jgi:hypothetical protein
VLHGAIEELLVEKIVADAWRPLRVPRFEARIHELDRQDRFVQDLEVSIQGLHDKADVATVALKLMKEKVEPYDRKEFERLQQDLKNARVNSQEPTLCEYSKNTQARDNLSRNEETLTRLMLRGLHELDRLKRQRAGEQLAAPAIVDVNVHIDRGRGEES